MQAEKRLIVSECRVRKGWVNCFRVQAEKRLGQFCLKFGTERVKEIFAFVCYGSVVKKQTKNCWMNGRQTIELVTEEYLMIIQG